MEKMPNSNEGVSLEKMKENFRDSMAEIQGIFNNISSEDIANLAKSGAFASLSVSSIAVLYLLQTLPGIQLDLVQRMMVEAGVAAGVIGHAIKASEYFKKILSKDSKEAEAEVAA